MTILLKFLPFRPLLWAPANYISVPLAFYATTATPPTRHLHSTDSIPIKLNKRINSWLILQYQSFECHSAGPTLSPTEGCRRDARGRLLTLRHLRCRELVVWCPDRLLPPFPNTVYSAHNTFHRPSLMCVRIQQVNASIIHASHLLLPCLPSFIHNVSYIFHLLS